MENGKGHKIRWKGRYNGGWKKTKNRMEGDTEVDGRRHKIGWKGIHRGDRMKGDTVVDGRRHNIA